MIKAIKREAEELVGDLKVTVTGANKREEKMAVVEVLYVVPRKAEKQSCRSPSAKCQNWLVYLESLEYSKDSTL